MGSMASREVLLGDKLASAEDPAAAAVCEKCMFVLKRGEEIEKKRERMSEEKSSAITILNG